MSLRVTTGEVRLCWPKLFEPESIGDSDPKYSTMLLIDKSDTDTIAALKAAEAQAKEEQKSKWLGKAQNKPSIIKDADEDGSYEDYPERRGCLYMSVSASQDYRPGVVDKSLNKIMDRSEVYSGVYARVSLTAFAYNFQGNRGLSFGLNNVMVLGKGDSLAGGVSAEDDFADFAEDAAALL